MRRGQAPRPKKSETLAVRVDAEVMERVYKLAEQEQVSTGEIMRRALALMFGERPAGNGASQ